MTLRTRIFIIISLVVLFILGVSVFLVYLSKKGSIQPSEPATTGEQTQTSGQNYQAPAGVSGATVQKQSTEEAIKNAAKQIAKIFVERYYSYSSENNYQNIKEVKNLVTDNLWLKISGKIGQPQANTNSGMTSKVISANFENYGNGSAAIRMQVVQEQQSAGTVTSNQKEIIVYETLVGGEWLVEKFVWQ